MLKGRNLQGEVDFRTQLEASTRVFVTLQFLEIRRWPFRTCYVLQRECCSCCDVTNCFGGEFASYIEPLWNLALIPRMFWFLVLSTDVEHSFASL